MKAAGKAEQRSYEINKLSRGVYALITRPGGAASSNAFFVEGDDYVLAGGAHMSKDAVADLAAAVASVTPKPIRYFVLPHHHRGFTSVDFDFPPGWDLIMSWQVWQALSEEVRPVTSPVLFFGDGLTLKLGRYSVILTNVGKAHTEGDALVYIPEAGVLYAGDLLYTKSVGFMGDGHMQDWVLALDFMEKLNPQSVIPGYGPVGTSRAISEFKVFFKDFLTAVLKHIEAGDTLEQTLATLELKEYKDYEGYKQFFKTNVERAYRELKAAQGQ